jgi:hypothetical protein
MDAELLAFVTEYFKLSRQVLRLSRAVRFFNKIIF